MKNTLCKNGCLPTRGTVAIMIFTACFVCYMLRVNMSINIIAMVDSSSKSNNANKQKQVGECIALNNVNSSSSNTTESLSKFTALPNYGVRYDWDAQLQGLILGSYFWGYILTSIPGGYLAERFGPTKTVGVSGVISAVLTILTPLSASWHYSAVITLRFILGIMGGVVYPALHCLVSRWAPPNEKGKFIGALMGGTLGTMLTWPILGYIIENWGWNWAFFAPGIFSIVWCCLWMILVSDTPETHPRISEDEKLYIAKSLGDNISKTRRLPPYWKIMTSVPFWALNVLHFGNVWGLYFLLTNGPMYMSDVLGFNLGHSGILAALPYLARLLAGFLFGYIGDTIRKNNWMTVTTIRKSFITFSHFLPGLLLFAMILAGCDSVLSVALITSSLGMNGASTITNLQNNQDLAPSFAGTIYGIINCFGGTTGFITPLLTGYITAEHNGLHEWHIIFSIGASVYIATGIVFCIFGTGEQQPWNQTSKQPDKTEGVENPAFAPPLEVTVQNCRQYEQY
ncbi:hypothetical protein ILUMI_23629 [Ignelater luminosus]|uniref:Major facilitator superfamily (MFS) profile domain-containing protein n=1 Tax=Ignelater luminosus TaxID=2038154 RepID=A0A8K0CC34_IGNLU|nr:hypothetical protein ILUMI_23629 [Ignelater luminosus]